MKNRRQRWFRARIALLGVGLTTIHVSYVEMGRSAAELLISQINDSSRPPRILMSRGELVVRSSCRCESVPKNSAPSEREQTPGGG